MAISILVLQRSGTQLKKTIASIHRRNNTGLYGFLHRSILKRVARLESITRLSSIDPAILHSISPGSSTIRSSYNMSTLAWRSLLSNAAFSADGEHPSKDITPNATLPRGNPTSFRSSTTKYCGMPEYTVGDFGLTWKSGPACCSCR